MRLTPRKVASLLGAAALGVTAIGASSAAGSTPRASVAAPSFARLSTSQVKARTSGKQQHVVVVFKDQLGNLPANRSHRRAREATAASMQAPLVSQLKQVGATRMTKLSLLNAVAATMPAAEARALANNPGVKAVVPDATVVIGDAKSPTPTVAPSQVAKAAMPGTAADGQQLCSSSPNKPLLEPEALTSIHDASDNPNDKQEASLIATGRGVVIGNVDADTLAGNPNLIRPSGQHVVIDAPDPNENVFRRRVQWRRLDHGRPGHGHLHLQVSAAVLEHLEELHLPNRG